MKKIVSLILLTLMLFSFFACSKYEDDYDAVMMSKSASDNKCSLKFSSLSGQVVLTPKNGTDEVSTILNCNAKLAEGEINIFYDTFEKDSEKILICNLKGGQFKMTTANISVPADEKIYIIVQTVTPAKGGDIQITF